MAESIRFDSMDQAVEKMSVWPADLPFPLRDSDSPEKLLEAFSATRLKEIKVKKEQTNQWEPRLTGRDAAVLLSYEDNAQKLEERVGWSSLHLWSMAYHEMSSLWPKQGREGGVPAPMSHKEMRDSFKALVNSGARMDAAYCMNPGLPIMLAKLDLLDEMTLMCEAGFPLNRPFTLQEYVSGLQTESHFFTFVQMCSRIQLNDDERRKQAMTRALHCALAQGASLEDRSTTGHTALGLALTMQDRSGMDVFSGLLLGLGADPTRVSVHPLALCANKPQFAQAALAEYQRRALTGVMEPAKTEKGGVTIAPSQGLRI